MTLFMGLDLGQAQDFTALSVVEANPTIKRQWLKNREVEVPGLPLAYHVRHLQRYALGTSYPLVVEDVSHKVRQLEETVLTIDHTGVGRPVFDLFETVGLRPLGITITGSDTVHGEDSQWRVPKRDLVGILVVAVQAKLLKVAKDLPDAAALVDELLDFRVKINLKTAHDSYEAWREGVHDDLVLSVAMACWTATQYYTSQEAAIIQSEVQQELDSEFEGIMRSLEL